MKRQPWFWPVKLFLKRIAGKELWLRPEVHYELRQRDSWKYIPGLLDAHAIVYSVGVGDLIDFFERCPFFEDESSRDLMLDQLWEERDRWEQQWNEG